MPRSRFFTRSAAFVVCGWLGFSPAAHADVQLSLRNGRVTIVAKDATLRQILTEWARVGRTTVVNVDRIPGGPLTLELRDVPEGEALDILLRSLSGYIAAPRTAAASDASVYDSIAVMPTLAQAATRIAGPGASGPAPFSPPAFVPNDDEESAAAQLRNGGPQPARPPIFAPFPGPQGGNPNNVVRPVLPVVRPGVLQPNNPNEFPPQQPPFPPAPNVPPTPGGQSPSGAVGVAAPGMIVPAPATSQPGQIPTPTRPPGD